MNNFLLIFKKEFIETVRTRFFKVTSVIFGIILLLALVGLILLQILPAHTDGGMSSDEVIPDDLVGITEDQTDSLEKHLIAVDDRTDGTLLARLEARTPLVEYQPIQSTDAAIRSAFENGADGCLIIRSESDVLYYIDPFTFNLDLANCIQGSLNQIAREDAMAQYGISASDATAILGMIFSMTYSEVSHSDLLTRPEDNGYSFSYTDTGTSVSIYLVSSLLFMAVSFYGQMVSARVSREKSSRMIEVLATSATPAELLCGKVLGVGAAGFAQVVTFYLLLLAIVGGGLHQLVRLAPSVADVITEIVSSAASGTVPLFIYLLLGFVQLAFIYGGLGAMSSDTESVSGFAALPLQLPMLGYFIAMLSPVISGSALLTAASHIPILSPFAMPARLSVEQVSLWEVILSVTLQLASIAVTAVLAARLYRRGMLRYGQPPRLKELFSALKK